MRVGSPEAKTTDWVKDPGTKPWLGFFRLSLISKLETGERAENFLGLMHSCTGENVAFYITAPILKSGQVNVEGIANAAP